MILRTLILVSLGLIVLGNPDSLSYAGSLDTPYLDKLKKELDENEKAENRKLDEDSGETEPYIDSVKKKLELEDSKDGNPPQGTNQPSYIDQLKATDPQRKEREAEESSDESYTETEKAKIPPQAEGGAIQAVMEGHSELKAKQTGEESDIHHAFGVRYGLSLTRALTGPAGIQLRGFNDVYGATYAPDFSIFYEIQPFHSDLLGNIGLMFMGGVGYYEGFGQFGYSVQLPTGGGVFPSKSTVKFQFFTLPVTIAANYRFNLFKILRPFIMFGPTAIGYVEMRNDGTSGNRGHSEGLFTSVGTSLLLDWISPGGAWDLYSTFGLRHYYLTFEYSKVTTFSGPVNVNIYGLSAGLTFEY